MNQILSTFVDIAPLYVFAVLGFIAGKTFKIDQKSISSINAFLIGAVVYYIAIAKLEFQLPLLIFPIVLYAIAGIFSAITLRISKLYLKDKTQYLAALGACNSNWAYFGIPIAFLLFSEEVAATYILICMGFQFSDSTFGMYYISRGNMNPQESFLNVFRYPVIYGVVLGLIFSLFQIPLPTMVDPIYDLLKDTFTVLGMMIIGLGLASLDRFTIDWKYVGTMMAQKFILWPALITMIITINKNVQLFDEAYHAPLILMSLMPMAANNIAFAMQFNMNPGKVSVAVLITTLFAAIYIPVMLVFFRII